MAHNIGRMFYCGERPWHGLGEKLDGPANLDDALTHGGLDWEVGTVPIRPEGEPNSEIRHRVAVVRMDRAPGAAGRVIGVVHPGFRPLQNRQGAEMFDAIVGQGQAIYHTGGYLKQGEVVWLLAKLPEDIRVRGDDVLESYLLFTNSHDGSVAIDIRLTTIRVVCQNTLSLALHKGAVGKVFRRAHDGRYDLLKQEAKDFFDFSVEQGRQTEALFRRLAEAKCDDRRFEAFLTKLMPDPLRPATASSNGQVSRAYETRLEQARESRKEVLGVHTIGIPARGIDAAEKTWWGALNSVTAWVDHVQATDADRYAHILFGAGDRIKKNALARVLAENAA